MWPGESWQANKTHLTKHLTSLPVAQAKLMMSLWKKGPCYGSRKSSRLRGLVGWSTSSSGYISLSVMSLFWETTDKVLPALCSVLSEVPFWVPCSGSQCLNSSPSVFQLLFPPHVLFPETTCFPAFFSFNLAQMFVLYPCTKRGRKRLWEWWAESSSLLLPGKYSDATCMNMHNVSIKHIKVS